MIYEGKEYKEVTDGSAEIGDLIHVTNTSGAECDVWCFSNDDNFETPCVGGALPGSYYCLDNEFDDYKRYRYLKDVEETPVKFKSGDRVRLTEFELNGQINFGNFNGYVDGEKFDGDYKVKFDDGSFVFFPQSSLELIKSYTIGQLKACEDFKKMIDELKAIGPLRNDVGVTPTNAVPKKVLKSPLKKEQIIPLTNPKKEHELINQTSKNIKQTDTVNSPSLSENINDLFAEIKNIIVYKNENYGDSFSKQYKKYGIVSVEMRLNDKFMRLEQLVKGEKDKVGESIEDTLKDIIGYATLALIELKDKG
ncbi:nucleotide modification associated domain-containing protein [Brochothrix thermosphacta]|uniref:nucleotide modification associated domain-containing protein n=1 Tax=Brochothrix thermosphacta TaxID=2756 RepID=UPI0003E881FE|nr:nucleotide modification associated domain-containing protein [Brochothrix thermosphacta]EUJ38188.1 hypothetical protein BTHER_02395 [Brochothrix thermosphacta DSM 20171 = FSL F6-1036]